MSDISPEQKLIEAAKKLADDHEQYGRCSDYGDEQAYHEKASVIIHSILVELAELRNKTTLHEGLEAAWRLKEDAYKANLAKLREKALVLSNLKDTLDTLEGSNRTDERYNRGWNDAINSIRINIELDEKERIR